MRDVVLARDVGAVGQGDRDVMTEVRVDGWQDGDGFRNAANTAKKVDC